MTTLSAVKSADKHRKSNYSTYDCTVGRIELLPRYR